MSRPVKTPATFGSGTQVSAALRRLLADPSEPLIHRDLGWLQFNDRVLAEARGESNPLLERVKFLSISSSNLDEFFMIRFASLNRPIRSLFKQGEQKRAMQLVRIRTLILRHVNEIHTAQKLVLSD